MDGIGDGLSLLAILGFVAFLIWHGNREKVDKRRLRLDEQNQLLDRLAANGSLSEFLQTEQGQKYLDRLQAPEKSRRPSPDAYRSGVVALLTAGLIALPMGAGFFFVAPRVEPGLLIPGAIIGASGIGCLIAAWVQNLLGRRWSVRRDDMEHGNRTSAQD